MTFINTVLPFLSALVSFVFAGFVFRRWAYKRKGTHLLFWGTGMIFYGIGGFCEGYYGAFGWNALVFRLWYLFGAILVAAWLGQGTVFLLAKEKWARTTMIILVLGSLWGVYKIFSAELDPSLLTSGELSGHAIITSGVRTLTPLFNLYGVVTLIGGAMYSAWIFFRKRVLLHRVIGNVLIATGAMAPAFGGAFSRFGIPSALYIGELIGAVLIFIGFLRATTPMAEKQTIVAPQPA
ncbi:MAG TPA: hypothetical protein PK530_16950 [Anaerolineales bacterium]|nr:hypothetical protein [Anaerolineales bacterium]